MTGLGPPESFRMTVEAIRAAREEIEAREKPLVERVERAMARERVVYINGKPVEQFAKTWFRLARDFGKALRERDPSAMAAISYALTVGLVALSVSMWVVAFSGG